MAVSRAGALVAGVAALLASGAATAETGAGAGKLRLLMVEQPGCEWCAAWDAAVGPAYPLTEEGRAAPLERVDILAVRGLALDLDRPARYTPTFILLRGDAELGRIEGYPGEDFFWGLLGRMLEEAGAR
ncbi:hypothetical protein [Rubrimonas cliftonensis]|uniref:Regulatory protein SoxS n=1 Tax=Rubrimonas cliftonensis TaxID=89524 RepID=A0A1H4DH20_9RHOB|nr:hypothetical protein [Rubrimonas cliftonensis]SEA71749.1 hypothetical protein SAMN05444370_11019 [Rubrimonas cliftonensis]